jgi:AcrR family transcriptional regulator
VINIRRVSKLDGMGHREDLLVGARRCLEERGYARTTARDLVAASGTNLASIGYHFGSKEALLNEAISQAFTEWAEQVRALALASLPRDDGKTEDPIALLVASWGAIRRSFDDHRGLAMAFVEAMAQAQRHPELRAQLADTYRRGRQQVAEMITRQLAGIDPAHAGALAAFEIAMCDGLLVQWLIDPDAVPSGELIVAAFGTVFGQAPRRVPGPAPG